MLSHPVLVSALSGVIVSDNGCFSSIILTLFVTGPSDMRQISFTFFFVARITSESIVKKFLCTYLYNAGFYDQYATTCAQTDFRYHISMWLESNQFVHCVFVGLVRLLT
jgi:hypothetical protein